MKKINFDDMQVFEQLEDQAIDGVLDYDSFPPEEYKYFSRLARLGYMNRHKGWSKELCEEKQALLRSDYSEDKARANEAYAWFAELHDNRIKGDQLEAAMYKAQSEKEMLMCAVRLIEKLLGEGGFEERMTKKLKGLRK